MDMNGAAHVPTGIDGLELGDPCLVGELDAAQEAEIGRLFDNGLIGIRARIVAFDAGVVAMGVTVPNIDSGVGERLASGGIVDQNLQSKRRARAAIGDVLPNQVSVEKVGTFREFRGEHARIGRRAGRARGRSGGAVLGQYTEFVDTNARGRGSPRRQHGAPACQHILGGETPFLRAGRIVRLVHPKILQ
ncbi:MAG: hypothetical protein R2848_01860 [Thermomicrobiales bacterium]